MKKLLSIISIVALAGCTDYVDIEPEYTRDAESPFRAAFEYDQALTGAYDLLQTSYLDIWIGEIASDNSIAGGESVTDSEGLHQIDAMTHGGVNQELRNLWRFNYAGITRTNFLFEKQNDLEFDGKAEIYGQAHFLRAYYYFQLVKYFGDVPLIIDRRIGTEEVSNLERTPASEVYDQIEADLIAAAEVLDWTVAEKGRITKGAALSLLGKVYVYQKKYAEAATVLDRVINEGPYSLYQGNYNDMFLVANEGNSEVVFDIQYTGIEGGGYDCFVCLEGFAAPGFHGIRGMNSDDYSDGNSYNLPTQDLFDSFVAGDPRRDASILDIDAYVEAYNQTVTDPDSLAEYTIGGGGHTGYYNNKYIKRQYERGAGDDDLTSPLNHIIIRYADVLLMAAEAHALKPNPDEGKALLYLNMVRDRVDLEPVSVSGSALVDAIFQERRWEFAGEGLRFFDLVRSGDAAAEIEGFTAGKNELFPIPQVEIDLAGGGWQQNPNY